MDPALSDKDANFLAELRSRLGKLYHDLNNPLAIASGNLQLIEELLKMGETEGVREAVADARESLSRFGALLQEFQALRESIERYRAGD